MAITRKRNFVGLEGLQILGKISGESEFHTMVIGTIKSDRSKCAKLDNLLRRDNLTSFFRRFNRSALIEESSEEQKSACLMSN